MSSSVRSMGVLAALVEYGSRRALRLLELVLAAAFALRVSTPVLLLVLFLAVSDLATSGASSDDDEDAEGDWRREVEAGGGESPPAVRSMTGVLSMAA